MTEETEGNNKSVGRKTEKAYEVTFLDLKPCYPLIFCWFTFCLCDRW